MYIDVRVKLCWYDLSFQTGYEELDADVTNLAMSVVGAYISWIDITLIANDRFVG